MSKASRSKRKALAARNARGSMSQARRPSRGSSDRSSKPAEPARSTSPATSVAVDGSVAAVPPSRGNALEEAFFREGQRVHQVHGVSLDGAMHGFGDLRPSRHAQPNAVARRASLRRVFAGVMGFASVLTVVVTAKALARHAEAAAAPMDTSLILPQVIVASIDLDAPPAEGNASDTTASPASGSGAGALNGRRVQQPPTW